MRILDEQLVLVRRNIEILLGIPRCDVLSGTAILLPSDLFRSLERGARPMMMTRRNICKREKLAQSLVRGGNKNNRTDISGDR